MKLDDKYSPNLGKWLRKQALRFGIEQKVFRDSDGVLWIGWLDDDLFLIGSQLMPVLCNGAKEKTFAHPLRKSWALQEVPGFWDEYNRVGRCAIDPEHEVHFISREGRYAENGDARTCKWCGCRQSRETYVERRNLERWVASPSQEVQQCLGG